MKQARNISNKKKIRLLFGCGECSSFFCSTSFTPTNLLRKKNANHSHFFFVSFASSQLHSEFKSDRCTVVFMPLDNNLLNSSQIFDCLKKVCIHDMFRNHKYCGVFAAMAGWLWIYATRRLLRSVRIVSLSHASQCPQSNGGSKRVRCLFFALSAARMRRPMDKHTDFSESSVHRI